MKRILTLALFFLGILFLSQSCQKAPFVTLNTPRSYTFTRDGGTQSITFTCNRDWSVSSSESWIQISPSSGSASDGEITVKITCAANTTYDPRSATVTVKVEELSEAVSISQDTGIGLIVSPKTFELTSAEQAIEIEVQKNVQYSVAIDNKSASWIIQGGTKALITDKVTFTIDANTSYDDREGKITFKQLDGNLSETVVVRQSQTNGLFVTTPEYSLSNEAHTLSVEVKANVDFEVTSQADWITYVETKALKASTITLSIPANEGYDNRTGTVLVKQKNGDLTGTITITQKQTDYLEVTPNSFDLDNQQHEIELKVTQNVAYSVVIPDDAKSWVYVPTKAATKGLVEDTIRLVVEANSTYDDREASVTIKQDDGSLAETVKIKQIQNDGLLVNKTEYKVTYEAQTLSLDIKANVDFIVKPEVEWIKYVETKSMSSSTVYVSIDENEAHSTREGRIVIIQKDGQLKQTVIINQIPYGAIDLGLSIYWASYNICKTGFVSSPEMFGDYYAWGETVAKNDYSWVSYKWANGSDDRIIKYCSLLNLYPCWDGSGEPDGKTVLEPEDDAASVILGGSWRIPTEAEWIELRDKCTWTWTTLNGVNGRVITGPNGNSIFLPAAGGQYLNTGLGDVGILGRYWSSSIYTDYPYAAITQDFSYNSVHTYCNCYRCCGLSVRPVCE